MQMRFGLKFHLVVEKAEFFDFNFIVFLNKLKHKQNELKVAI